MLEHVVRQGALLVVLPLLEAYRGKLWQKNITTKAATMKESAAGAQAQSYSVFLWGRACFCQSQGSQLLSRHELCQ